MARIRSIKPEFWEDEGVAELSFPARLLFICSWNIADDEGLLRWTPEYLKGQAFPYDSEVGVKKSAALMAEIVAGSFVYPYKGGRSLQTLGYIIKFRKHQRINRPQAAKLPPPSLLNPEVRLMYARRDGWVCGICNETIPEQVGPAPQDSYAPSDLEDSGRALSIDHIVPVSKGGTDYPGNVRAAHLACNEGRGNRDDPLTAIDVNSSVSPPDIGSRPIHGTFTEPFTAGREGKGKEGKGKEQQQGAAAAAAEIRPPKIVEEAIGVIVDRRVNGHDIDNVAGYRIRTTAGLFADHARTLATLDPAAFDSPEALADWLEPASKAAPKPSPVDRTQAAERVRGERNAAEPCPRCETRGGFGWLPDVSPAVRCPACTPAEALR